MKSTIFFLFSCFILITVKAQTPYRFNEELFVGNPQGTALYLHGDDMERELGRSSYGTSIRIVDTKMNRFHHQKEVVDGFFLSGYLVKVISDQDTGYVFDRDLSRLPAFISGHGARGLELLKTNYHSESAVHSGVRQNSELGDKVELNFKEGVSYLGRQVGNCSSESFILTQASRHEAYYFMYAVYSNVFDIDAEFMNIPKYNGKRNGADYFVITKDNKLQEIELKKVKSGYEISSYVCHSKG